MRVLMNKVLSCFITEWEFGRIKCSRQFYDLMNDYNYLYLKHDKTSADKIRLSRMEDFISKNAIKYRINLVKVDNGVFAADK